jgi:3-dehydroquinate synthase
MKRIPAALSSRTYDVLVGRGRLAGLGEALTLSCPGGRAVVCCDQNVAPLYLEQTRSSLRASGYEVSHIVIPAGEAQKNLARAEELYGVLYDRGIRRRDTVVALGGGVVGDLAGFVAATFQRGVRLVQVPTTLLAQVDAAVGGKVAVDFRAGKNYVGTFYQPWLVYVDLAALDTLPARELRSGAAEVAKYALLSGGELLDRVARLAGGPLTAARVTQELVAECVAYKVAVVAADEREETGARAVLNLGHTIGHAIEAATAFSRYTHGEAVGLGLRASLWLSRRLCGLDAREEARGQALLDGLGLPRRLEGVPAASVGDLTRRDKKAGSDGVGYVLLDALGSPRLEVLVPPRLEREVVEWLLSR